jgi:hypothetical protein
MSKVKLDWFKLENYEPSKSFSAKEWEREIIDRLLMVNYLSRFKTDVPPEEQSFYEHCSEVKEHIKSFGLINTNQPQNKPSLIVEKSSSENKFVNNLSTIRGLGFLHYSDRQDEFINDMLMWESLPIGSDELKKWYEKNHFKYDHAMSDEILDMYNRLHKLRSPEAITFENNEDDGERFLSVDLYASDEIIKMEFERWLKLERVKSGIEITEKNFKRTDFNDWSKNQILACWDIVTISNLEGFKIGNEVIGRLLFPNDYDVSLAERVRKVIRPKAKRVINEWVYEALSAQAKTE